MNSDKAIRYLKNIRRCRQRKSYCRASYWRSQYDKCFLKMAKEGEVIIEMDRSPSQPHRVLALTWDKLLESQPGQSGVFTDGRTV